MRRASSRSSSPDKKLFEEGDIKPTVTTPLTSPSPNKRKGHPLKNAGKQRQITDFFVTGTVTPLASPSIETKTKPTTSHSVSANLEDSPSKKRGRPPKRSSSAVSAAEGQKDKLSPKKKQKVSPSPLSIGMNMDSIVAQVVRDVGRRTTPPLEEMQQHEEVRVETSGLSRGRSKKKSIIVPQKTKSPQRIFPSSRNNSSNADDNSLPKTKNPPSHKLTRGRSKEESPAPTTSPVKSKSPSPCTTGKGRKALASEPSQKKGKKKGRKSGKAGIEYKAEEPLFLPLEVKTGPSSGGSNCSGKSLLLEDYGNIAAIVKERAVQADAEILRKSLSHKKKKTKSSSKEQDEYVNTPLDTTPVPRRSDLKSKNKGSSSAALKSGAKKKLFQSPLKNSPKKNPEAFTSSGRPRRSVTTKAAKPPATVTSVSSGKKGSVTEPLKPVPVPLEKGKGQQKKGLLATPVLTTDKVGKTAANKTLNFEGVSKPMGSAEKKKFGDKDAMRKYLKKKALAHKSISPLALGKKMKKGKVLQAKVNQVDEDEDEETVGDKDTAAENADAIRERDDRARRG